MYAYLSSESILSKCMYNAHISAMSRGDYSIIVFSADWIDYLKEYNSADLREPLRTGKKQV